MPTYLATCTEQKQVLNPVLSFKDISNWRKGEQEKARSTIRFEKEQ